VARVRQIVAKFDQGAVNFGDPKAPAPLSVSCSDAQAGKGTGRWTDAKAWVYDFENDLPPGVRCTVTRIPTFKPSAGGELTGPERYQFNTGGPFVRSYMPGTYEPHRRAADVRARAQRRGHAGERAPERLVRGRRRGRAHSGQAARRRAARRPAQGLQPRQGGRERPAALRHAAVQPHADAGTKVQVVYGKGVATPSGVANNVERRSTSRCASPSRCRFTCERENAQAACLPLRPMQLQFNAPVTRKLASQIRSRATARRSSPSSTTTAARRATTTWSAT
jgi:hypothetical protein